MEIELNQVNFEALVSSEAAGWAAPDELAHLSADPRLWATTLRRLLVETDEALASAASIRGEERDQVLADLSQERSVLAAAVRRVTGEDPDGAGGDRRPARSTVDPEPAVPEQPVGPLLLQASWSQDQVVLWAGNAGAPPAAREDLDGLLSASGAAAIQWTQHRGVPVPGGSRTAAVAAPLNGALGWLVGVGAGQLGGDAAPSVRWLGEVAVWAAELVAQGRMVPTLVPSGSGGPPKGGTTLYTARWVPAVINAQRLRELAARMPGAVAALDPSAGSGRVCRSVLSASVDAVCRAGASRLVTAATVPVARTRADVAESVLAGLDGVPFTAATRPATETADELRRWASSVTAETTVTMTVRLSPPERDGGWLLTVEANGVERQPLPVERALATPSRGKAQEVDAQIRRLERLLPVLCRPSSRRGQVVVDNAEAWDLMAETGPALLAAGFDVRVPAVSGRRPASRLQLRAESLGGPSRVGAHQLSRVCWSVLFDDLELDSAEVARLAAQARPLVRVKGRWVELDQADLAAAAKALSERASTTELSGAAILRHAVGLEGTGLGGPVVVDGGGWAVDLVHGATVNPPQPLGAPDGFVGELREYQAEARGWLEFLDRAGLGGCLAMDMGLGKTPTVLAHLLAAADPSPALVIAPSAVIGNWAAEAARFTPSLRVRIHHGGDRARPDDIAAEAASTDILVTTYATAVRDIDALCAVEWSRVVVDEAQTIKNPASETAQQLRRLRARSRLALTGTPIENGLGDLWAILDFANPGLVGPRPVFVEQLSKAGDADGRRTGAEAALRALNGLLLFRRSKTEPQIAAELPDKIDELDHCSMTREQIGLYQAVLEKLLTGGVDGDDPTARKGQVLAAITALKQICNHPAAYLDDDGEPLDGRSGKLSRLEDLVESVFAAGERLLIFSHFARWAERLATHLSERTGVPIACYHGGLSRPVRDRMVADFQEGTGPGALVLSIKAGGSGLNLTAANHVVLYDRWWNPAVEDQARDRAWRIGQKSTVVSHRLVCPGTVDERVEEVVAGKRRIADLVLPASSSLGDLGSEQLRLALGLRPEAIIDESPRPSDEPARSRDEETAA